MCSLLFNLFFLELRVKPVFCSLSLALLTMWLLLFINSPKIALLPYQDKEKEGEGERERREKVMRHT